MSDIVNKIVEALQPNIIPDAVIGGAIKVDMEDSGVLHIDGTAAPATLTTEDKPADATLVCTPETFEALLKGEMDGMQAFAMGKLKVTGDMQLAGKMSQLFSKA